MKNFLKNYLSTIIFISIFYWFYSNNNYFIGFFNGVYSFAFNKDFILNIKDVFFYIYISYIFLLIPFYIFSKENSKARIVINFIKNKIKNKKTEIKNEEKTAILAWLVKGFFAPLMIFWLTGHIFNLSNNIYNTFNNLSFFSKDFLYFFNQYFFYMAFSAILFFDVLFFTLGYLIEGNIFKNKIKSVDPTIFGWFVALASYPPINTATNNILGWYSSDFPKFNNFYLHIILNLSILILMGIYSWASISLGLKASNLTNRGIVKSGPYKYIRHPAYFCKNLSWWIGGLPVIIASISNLNLNNLILAILSLSLRSYIYYLRAITEERHLSLDKDYLKYSKEVKYMFIPGVK